LRAVDAAVVGYDDFAVNAMLPHGSLGLLDADCQRVRFIQAGNDHRQFV
jgi:hypothetical protein